jgi:hypothetical protein
MSHTYLTTTKLAERLPYTTRHIREYLKDRVFIEGYHYVRIPGSRRLMFIWERVEETLLESSTVQVSIPLSSGGYINV